MTRDCDHIQEKIVEVGGAVEDLERGLLAHVEACDACRQVAELEAGLSGLLMEAVPPDDPVLQQRIAEAVVRYQRRRRVWSILPIAASLMIAVFGAVAMGGVPAGGLAAHFATGSGAGWTSLLTSLGGLVTVFSTTFEALAQAVTPAFGLLAAGGMLLGGFSFGTLSRRWKLQPEWRVRS